MVDFQKLNSKLNEKLDNVYAVRYNETEEKITVYGDILAIHISSEDHTKYKVYGIDSSDNKVEENFTYMVDVIDFIISKT